MIKVQVAMQNYTLSFVVEFYARLEPGALQSISLQSSRRAGLQLETSYAGSQLAGGWRSRATDCRAIDSKMGGSWARGLMGKRSGSLWDHFLPSRSPCLCASREDRVCCHLPAGIGEACERHA